MNWLGDAPCKQVDAPRLQSVSPHPTLPRPTHHASRITHHASRILLALLLTACSVSLPGLPNAPAARIAYVTPDGLIATITPGGEPTIVTPAAPGDENDPKRRRYNWPAWSPDGRRLAFIAIDGSGYSGAILVAEPTGANRVIIQELQSGYPVYLSWSPDGSTVAMLTSGDETLNLLIGDSSGRGESRRLSSGQPLYSSWSPDSRALLVHTGGGYYAAAVGRLTVISTDPGAMPERIDIDPESFRAPAWSPTGAYLAVAGDNGVGEAALFLRTRDGVLRRFADLAGPPAIVWSPAGDRLAWSSLDGLPFAYRGLQVATPDGRTRLQITDERLFAFFWSPDGGQIAYFTLDEGERALLLRVIGAGGGTARTVAAFQPTRDYIQLVTYFDQYAQSATIWSPDSRTLLYAGWPPEADTDAPPALYTVPADGAAPAQMLTPGRIGFYAPPPPRDRQPAAAKP